MRISHVKMLKGIEDIRVEVEDDFKHFPVKVSVKQEGNDLGITASNLFVLEPSYDERIRRFAMVEISNYLK